MCSSDTKFNPITATCDKLANVTSPTCSKYAVYNETKKECVCAASTPYDNGAVCVACDKPYYWNSTAKACQQCLDGQVYNPSTLACQLCPASSPIERNGSCYACPVDSHYIEAQQICLSCPPSTVFNSTNNKCMLISTTPTCPPLATYSNVTKECVCPIEKPFNNGKECLACPTSQHWNTTSKTCTVCSDGFFYV